MVNKKRKSSWIDWKSHAKDPKELQAIFDEQDCNEAVQESVKRVKEFAYHELKILKRRFPKATWPQERFNLIFNEVWLNDPTIF